MVLRASWPQPCPNISSRVRELPNGERWFQHWSRLGYSQTTKNHRRCSEEECFANDLPENCAYRTKHVEESCTCPFFGWDYAALSTIYSTHDTAFPVTAVRRDESGKVSGLNVRAYTPGLQYIAISHVIADGRGNANGPALPMCQLDQIDMWVRIARLQGDRLRSGHDDETRNDIDGQVDHDKVIGNDDDSDSTTWFWMDTLCVPAHLNNRTTNQEPMQSSMKNAILNSSSLLVLDSDVLSLTWASPPEDIFLRLNFSSWSSRLWTLQEAVLAPRILFQFQEAPISLSFIIQRLREANSSAMGEERLVIPEAPLLVYSELRKYLIRSDVDHGPGSEKHVDLLRATMQKRKASAESDEARIWRNLIGGVAVKRENP